MATTFVRASLTEFVNTRTENTEFIELVLTGRKIAGAEQIT
jgi:hypothetical protein